MAESPRTVKREVTDFFRLLFDRLPLGEFIELRFIGERRPPKSFWAGSVEDAVDKTVSFGESAGNEGMNLYAGVASRTEQGKGSADFLGHTQALWIDVDDTSITLKDLLARCKTKAIPKPSLVLHTGGGLHAYWLLESSAPLRGKNQIERVVKLNTILKNALGGDNCQDAPRIMRIGGTTNYPSEKKRKKGRVIVPCSIVRKHSDRYKIEALEAALKPLEHTPAKDSTAPRAATRNLDYAMPESWELPADVQRLFNQNPKIKARYEGDTENMKNASGSEVDFSLVGMLLAHDLSSTLIHQTLRARNREFETNKGQLDDRKLDNYIRRTLTKALQYQNAQEQAPTGTIEANKAEGAEVEIQSVEWLWHPRIPMAQLSMIDGMPGVGKSIFLMELAAKTTTGGRMPDGFTLSKQNVLYLCSEDTFNTTILPRFIAAGGDPSRLFHVDYARDEDGRPLPITIPGAVPDLEALCLKEKIGLVLIDPITSFIDADTKNDASVRHALASLHGLAQRTGAAVVMIRHFNKDSKQTDAMLRGSGSMAYISTVRVAMMIVRDPEDSHRNLLGVIKNNLTPFKGLSLAYKIEGKKLAIGGGRFTTVGVLQWDGTSEREGHAFLEPADPDAGSISGDELLKLIDDYGEGGWIKSPDLDESARIVHGATKRTIERRRSELKNLGLLTSTRLSDKGGKKGSGSWWIHRPETPMPEALQKLQTVQ